jgi:hypothetical protein
VPRRGSLGILAERCSCEPWPGSVLRVGPTLAPWRSACRGRAVWGHTPFPFMTTPTATTRG